MRKKDPEFNENIDRSVEKDKTSPAADESNQTDKDNIAKGQFTKVKNASASGLGTMGRSDEKLSDQSDNNHDVY